MRKLPFPGHSWSFTQHAVAIEEQTVLKMLRCASPFIGTRHNLGRKITALMVGEGILTNNVRDGQDDSWRDYQQVLPELGLIYSTSLLPSLTFTNCGHMLLAGELSFEDLLDAQALSYQYPNGQKVTIQSRLKSALASDGLKCPDSLIELHMDHGLLLKPAVLILRVLLELFKAGHKCELTVDECQAFLLPCTRNNEWPVALAEIIEWRTNRTNVALFGINTASRRNFQDWFKFLSKTSYFRLKQGNQLSIKTSLLQRVTELEEICLQNEDLSTFWIPAGYDTRERIAWFNWYGDLGFAAQAPSVSDQEDFSQEKEANSENPTDLEPDTFEPISSGLQLSPIDFLRLESDPEFTFDIGDTDDVLAKLREGAYKRFSKTLLHNKIVAQLATEFSNQGATVMEDSNSVDLFAQWPCGRSAIFEVKTVTKRNLQNRLREAIGQIEEYTYREKKFHPTRSDRVIVINTDLPSDAWQVEFLNQHLNIGLICRSARTHSGYSPKNSDTAKYWSKKLSTSSL